MNRILYMLKKLNIYIYILYFSKKNTPYKGSLFYVSLQIFLRKNV